MPILLPAELHRFAMGCAEERLAQVVGDPRFDGGLPRDTVTELVVYHRRCLELAEAGPHHFGIDSVVDCGFAEETHGRAEMFFSMLSHEHTSDMRYNEVAWHHAMVKDAIDDDPDGLAERYFAEVGKGKGVKGKGKVEDRGGAAGAAFEKGYQKGYREGMDSGFNMGFREGYFWKGKGKSA